MISYKVYNSYRNIYGLREVCFFWYENLRKIFVFRFFKGKLCEIVIYIFSIIVFFNNEYNRYF